MAHVLVLQIHSQLFHVASLANDLAPLTVRA